MTTNQGMISYAETRKKAIKTREKELKKTDEFLEQIREQLFNLDIIYNILQKENFSKKTKNKIKRYIKYQYEVNKEETILYIDRELRTFYKGDYKEEIGNLWYKNIEKYFYDFKTKTYKDINSSENEAELIESLKNNKRKLIYAVSLLIITEESYYRNLYRQEQFKNKAKYAEYCSIFDDRTCSHCSSLSGRIYRLGKEPRLPMHPRCRCFFIYY